ncbi:MAG: aminodeoxychorismate synthase component I [Sphingomonadaceae bacterium]|nr:aminodeoxychorismate synthase component I [Sphingomonadaceae bacterium]
MEGPFVLLDDARGDGAAAARLFTNPRETVSAHDAEEVAGLLDTLDQWLATGAHVAGFLSYGAGYGLEPKLATLPCRSSDDGAMPIGWFGRFDAPRRIDAADIPAWLPDGAGAMLLPPRPLVTRDQYDAMCQTILDHIIAGDIYQANLTFATEVAVHGHPLAAYARLRDHARAPYGGVIFTGQDWLLSHSPELFFARRDGQIIARPMKGTARRGADAASDAALAQSLRTDAKQRAENLMIVDLLRNDLSRIAADGSVEVPALFRVETYPSVHQMVSDVTARLPDDLPLSTVLRALFPCGSITGAPKIRAMEIIDMVEMHPRGAYTGAIGFAAPDGEAAFNVAIRTLAMADAPPQGALPGQPRVARLGLGSGIVADSQLGAEWRESLDKGAFVARAGADFDLIETMRFAPDIGVCRLEAHLARLGDSARALGFVFDRHRARNLLQQVSFRLDGAAKLRLLLSPTGAMAVESGPLPAAPTSLRVGLVPMPVAPDDFRLFHKVSDRAFLDDARRSSGCDEVIFVADDGRLTQGSFTNIFVERDGVLLTPPRSAGLLPGILRAEYLESGRAVEQDMTADDLAGGFMLGNALRGLMAAHIG